jgi:hypothetical protein
MAGSNKMGTQPHHLLKSRKLIEAISFRNKCLGELFEKSHVFNNNSPLPSREEDIDLLKQKIDESYLVMTSRLLSKYAHIEKIHSEQCLNIANKNRGLLVDNVNELSDYELLKINESLCLD